MDVVQPPIHRRRLKAAASGLRADVLRLHAMAHALVNGAPLTTDVENLAIWELADALESELMEIEEGAKRAMKLLRPLLKLAPHE
jgi:hypothetical protein